MVKFKESTDGGIYFFDGKEMENGNFLYQPASGGN